MATTVNLLFGISHTEETITETKSKSHWKHNPAAEIHITVLK